jgi:hypothetical protein
MIKDEKTFKVKVKGASPFIMHDSACADPYNSWTLKMAPLKAKRKKTIQEAQEIRELSFLSCLYWSEELSGIYVPTDNVRKMILEAGRSCDQKNAKKQVVGIRFPEYLGWQFQVKNRNNLQALKEDPTNKYFKIVTINKSKVPPSALSLKSGPLNLI